MVTYSDVTDIIAWEMLYMLFENSAEAAYGDPIKLYLVDSITILYVLLMYKRMM